MLESNLGKSGYLSLFRNASTNVSSPCSPSSSAPSSSSSSSSKSTGVLVLIQHNSAIKTLITLCPILPHVGNISGSLTPFWFLNGKRRTLGFKPGAIFTSLECGRDGSRSTHFPSEPFPPPFRYCTSMNTVTPISRLAVSINFFAKAGNRLVAL